MKNLKLDFVQRFGLANFIAGLSVASLGTLESLRHIYDKVRFSDQEWKSIRVTDAGNGQSTYEPPNQGFGAIEVQIEDADAGILIKIMEGREKWDFNESSWAIPVAGQLSASRIP